MFSYICKVFKKDDDEQLPIEPLLAQLKLQTTDEDKETRKLKQRLVDEDKRLADSIFRNKVIKLEERFYSEVLPKILPCKPPSFADRLLIKAVKENNLQAVKYAIDELHANPRANHNEALRLAVVNSRYDIVVYILNHKQGVDRHSQFSYILRYAHLNKCWPMMNLIPGFQLKIFATDEEEAALTRRREVVVANQWMQCRNVLTFIMNEFDATTPGVRAGPAGGAD